MDAPMPTASAPVPIPSHGQAQPPTYYGQPALKPTHYRSLVGVYIFISGLPGAGRTAANAAEIGGTRGSGIILAGRAIAVTGAVLGGILLIIDLHTRRRFYNMLRIFRPTSPMSIGTYVLMGFGL